MTKNNLQYDSKEKWDDLMFMQSPSYGFTMILIH